MRLDHSGLSVEDQAGTSIDRASTEENRRNETQHEEQVGTEQTEFQEFNRVLAERMSDLCSITTISDHPAYVYLNPSHKKILGHEQHEMLGKSPLDFIHPEDHQEFLKLLKRSVLSRTKENPSKQSSAQRVLYRIKDHTGHYRLMETTVDRLGEGNLLLVSKDATEDSRAREKLQEDDGSLKQRVLEQREEIANSKKVLKEEIFKRWRAEEALRESEEKSKRLLDSFEDGYFEVDLAGNLTFFNESLCRMMGYSHQEMMGMNNRQYMTEKTAKTVYETFNEVYRTGKQTKAFDWELTRKDGEKRYLETSISPVRNAAGELIGFRGIARDVTERRLARRALEESEQKYRTILQSIEDGYYEVALNGSLTFFNEALCKITGYSPDELHGMNNRDYTDPETSKKMFEIFNRVYQTGQPERVSDYEVIKKDGTKCIVELSASLIRDPAGNGVGFRGIARDRTEHRLIRKALEQSEEKYRTILQSIEDGYYEVDISGNMVFFNDSMCKILGCSSDELMGMNNRKYMSEETAKTVYGTFNQVYRSGEATKVLGWELIQKDGQKRYVETSISLVRDGEGTPVGFRGIARDITEHKLLEKAKERTINHLSHELLTPLSIIEGALARIAKAVEEGDLGKIEEWADKSRRHIHRLKSLQAEIDDILNSRPVKEKEKILYYIEAALSQLDALKEEPLKESAEDVRQGIVRRLEALYRLEEIRTEVIPLEAFLDEVCSDAIQAMRDRKLEISRNFETGIYIQMDRKMLKTICDGFLRNAIENTPDEGRIDVRMRHADRVVRVDFQDFGVGITPENQKWIFGGFFHTQDTHHYASKKPYLFNAGGSGSDLLRAKVLSERFGFSVDFSSTRCTHLPRDSDECPGSILSCAFIKNREECLSSGGSTFSLLLPLK